jgi:hypothetical protein
MQLGKLLRRQQVRLVQQLQQGLQGTQSSPLVASSTPQYVAYNTPNAAYGLPLPQAGGAAGRTTAMGGPLQSGPGWIMARACCGWCDASTIASRQSASLTACKAFNQGRVFPTSGGEEQRTQQVSNWRCKSPGRPAGTAWSAHLLHRSHHAVLELVALVSDDAGGVQEHGLQFRFKTLTTMRPGVGHRTMHHTHRAQGRARWHPPESRALRGCPVCDASWSVPAASLSTVAA